jgi:predicted N-acetyltransferase YhbS
VTAVTIRLASPDDAAVCGRICYEAFRTISEAHGFPPDVPVPEAGIGILTWLFSHPRHFCVVAELDGRVVGSNCLDERSSIAGVGPITIDPAVQNRRIGRLLMEAVLDRARQRGAPGVRLVQAAFHNRSLALYNGLGFDAREPLSVMQGPGLRRETDGLPVRPATSADLDACNRLCMRVHGMDRDGELSEAISAGTAVVVERHGKITGYATIMAFFGHAVGRRQRGTASPDRRRGRIPGSWDSGPDAKRRAVPVVPRAGAACGRTDDADESRLVQ